MFSFLPQTLKGVLSIILYTANTFFWCVPLFSVAILKFCIPVPVFRRLCNRLLIHISFAWILCNNLNQDLFHRLDIVVDGAEDLKPDDWYLVISNHQTWVDILVLQRVFYRKIPFLKFFLKKELIWVPILGLAWWALDFPFMKRYSGAFLKKHPHLKGKDIEITKKACAKFSEMPVSVMNFLEGTRFTSHKHQAQQSPFTRLLKPKAGGIAFVMAAMGEYLNSIVNVTIAYPPGPKSFWDFLCGRVTHIRVHVEVIPITDVLIGDYFEDENFRENFQEWVNTVWQEKDRRIAEMDREIPGNVPPN